MYATASQVRAYCPMRTFGASTVPSLGNVDQFLTDVSAELDGIVAGLGYTAPVESTASVAFAQLSRLTALGAWAQVEAAAPVSDDVDRSTNAWRDARAELAAGKLDLVDAPRNADTAFSRAPAAASPFFVRDQCW